jgi:hypothetical protein
MTGVREAQAARRAYVAGLLAGAAAEGLERGGEALAEAHLSEAGLRVAGRVAVPADELDRLFAAVTLQREVKSGLLDAMGMFDERAAPWDVSKPELDQRAQELARKLGDKPTHAAGAGRLRVILSHDVDRTTFCEPTTLLKGAWRSLRRRCRDASLMAAFSPKALYRVYEWLLARERHYGACAYYFMLAGPYGVRRYSSRCDIRWSASKDLGALIRGAGMRIGLHGSYYARERDSYREERLRVEESLGVPVTCHRNHYLRFDPVRLWRQMEEAGFEADFSVGFNYRLGFRAGCGNVYPGYDFAQNRVSRVCSVPLLFMDGVLAGADRSALLRELRESLEEARRVGGCVSLLFHPELFVVDPGLMDVFEEVMQMCVALGADVSGKLPAARFAPLAADVVGGGASCVA